MVSTISVTKVTDGLGFGDGAVSYEEQASLAGNEDLRARMDSVVHNVNILVPIDLEAHDDGCGDGRAVAPRTGAISSKINGEVRVFSHSLNRAKVFGGGATMATAMRIGTGVSEVSLAQAFSEAIAELQHAGIDFGAHTHADAELPNSGCGAIDEAPAVLRAAGVYRAQITAVILRLLGQSDDDATASLDIIFSHFAAMTEHIGAYQGAATVQAIIDAGKVIKELAGLHKEVCILLNMVPDYTVDQVFFRDQMSGRAQAFAVDVWRLQVLAQALYKDEPTRQTALLSELVYTLGTAAVLTKGDLPVYILSE